jgi:hypothetical protein
MVEQPAVSGYLRFGHAGLSDFVDREAVRDDRRTSSMSTPGVKAFIP